MVSSFRMAGERPVQPDKTVSRASTLASTLWRVRVFPARLIVVGGVPRPYMFACDLPPDRLGAAPQSCANGNGSGGDVLLCAGPAQPGPGPPFPFHTRPSTHNPLS